MQPIIEIEHLSYSYPDGKQALRDISLHIHPGEKVALVGANGAGKSTLLMHLNGVFTGTGRITVDGVELNKNTVRQIRAKVGLVFQNPDDQLFSPTVYEDVAFGLLYQGQSPEVVDEAVIHALAAVGLSGYAERNPYHLSGGEKKRAAIATVLSMQPQVLALDEPTAGLDPRSRRELIDLLDGLPHTSFIASHDLAMVAQLATRTIVMEQGEVAANGPTAEILGNEALLWKHGLS
ncbi:MAG: energy-coupling factor ABC transporter ATP-binding protein [Anaerolineaceae bacterium]